MPKLEVSYNKTLKLTNACIVQIMSEEFEEMYTAAERMDNYIKSKGALPIGPLVQYSDTTVNEEGELDIVIKFIRQANNYINHLEPPYTMESVLRIKDCMYVRYSGDESKMKFAYDKINLTAYEEDIKLKGGSYTVFVDGDDDGNVTADVFMEKEDE